MKGRKQITVGALVQVAVWLCATHQQPALGAGGRLTLGGPAGAMSGRTGAAGSSWFDRPEQQRRRLHQQHGQAGADVGDSQTDLIRVYELDSGAVRWVGGRLAGDLAPESQVVAVHFGQSPASDLKLMLADKLVNKTKQSQEFDLDQQQQQQQQASSSSQPPSGEPSSATPVSSATEATTGSASDEPASPEPATQGAVNATTPPGWPIQPATDGSTTTPAPTSESAATSASPVGSRVDREGDAVLCGEANANGKSNRRLISDRIVGGHKTEPGEFPFQVRLNIRSRRGSGICGGVVLDSRHVLTAAHCMTACVSHQLITATIESSGVKVTVGDHSIKSDDGELELDAETITPHEKYDACNFYANDHDIALIKTAAPIPFKFTTDGYGSVNRPCMPAAADVQYAEGEPVIVSGWGVTRENSGALSNILRYVQVPVVNVTRCQETYGSRVTQDHVCAGFQAGGKDSCQGDSGGPLVRVVENRYELVGIVSFGYGCGQAGAAGVYTRVASYLDWIKTNTRDF